MVSALGAFVFEALAPVATTRVDAAKGRGDDVMRSGTWRRENRKPYEGTSAYGLAWFRSGLARPKPPRFILVYPKPG